jgi:hypothetical protein
MAAQRYGSANAVAVYQDALRDIYADQISHVLPLSEPDLPIADQFASAINMVQIRQLDNDSILPILEEDLAVESEGCTKAITKTVTDILAETPSPPRCFPGGALHDPL